MAAVIPAPEQSPVVSLGGGAVIPVAIRTGLQQGLGMFLVEGIVEFDLADLTAGQEKWLGLALGIVVCGIQNFLESRANRKLLGRSPAPAIEAAE